VAQIPTLSSAAAKGANVTISLTVNAAAKVMFYVNGKRIANCLARVTSGSYPNNVATCTWKPTINGKAVITATVTPVSGTFTAITSPVLTTFVDRRSGLR